MSKNKYQLKGRSGTYKDMSSVPWMFSNWLISTCEPQRYTVGFDHVDLIWMFLVSCRHSVPLAAPSSLTYFVLCIPFIVRPRTQRATYNCPSYTSKKLLLFSFRHCWMAGHGQRRRPRQRSPLRLYFCVTSGTEILCTAHDDNHNSLLMRNDDTTIFIFVCTINSRQLSNFNGTHLRVHHTRQALRPTLSIYVWGWLSRCILSTRG